MGGARRGSQTKRREQAKLRKSIILKETDVKQAAVTEENEFTLQRGDSDLIATQSIQVDDKTEIVENPAVQTETAVPDEVCEAVLIEHSANVVPVEETVLEHVVHVDAKDIHIVSADGEEQEVEENQEKNSDEAVLVQNVSIASVEATASHIDSEEQKEAQVEEQETNREVANTVIEESNVLNLEESAANEEKGEEEEIVPFLPVVEEKAALLVQEILEQAVIDATKAHENMISVPESNQSEAENVIDKVARQLVESVTEEVIAESTQIAEKVIEESKNITEDAENATKVMETIESVEPVYNLESTVEQSTAKLSNAEVIPVNENVSPIVEKSMTKLSNKENVAPIVPTSVMTPPVLLSQLTLTRVDTIMTAGAEAFAVAPASDLYHPDEVSQSTDAFRPALIVPVTATPRTPTEKVIKRSPTCRCNIL